MVGVIVILVAAIAVQGGGSTTAITKPSEPAPAALIDGRSIGPSDAAAKMDVWSDFQCPGCGIFSREVEPRLINQYIIAGKLRITYHDFAFVGQESLDAATAARCAGEQGQFWHYMQYVFANQSGENEGHFTRALLDGIARDLDLDVGAFDACLADGKETQAVLAETAEGNALPVTSTPTILVNGQKVASLAFSDITKAIDDAIANPQGVTPAPATPEASSTPSVSTAPPAGATPPVSGSPVP